MIRIFIYKHPQTHDRITAHASASLWRAQLHTPELNIQVRSHDRISAHVCWFPVYTGSVSGKHSQTYKTPHLGTYPLRHIYLSFIYRSFVYPRTEYLIGRSPLFSCRLLLLQSRPPAVPPFLVFLLAVWQVHCRHSR